MRWLILALFATTVLASLGSGSAASMRVWSDDITTATIDGPAPIGTTNEAVAADSAPVVDCDLDTVSVGEVFARDGGGTVVAVYLKDIGADCALGQVSVAVVGGVDGTEVIARSRGVLSGEPSQELPLDNVVSSESIARVDVDLLD